MENAPKKNVVKNVKKKVSKEIRDQ